MLKSKVQAFIRQEKLVNEGDKLLVACSGGSDSVALLSVLKTLGYDCMAAHMNFSLRDEESERDEAFVRSLCQQWNIPLQVKKVDTKSYAKEKGISIEMAARELRYEWFEQLRQEHHLQAIALGHHQDDDIETFFLNLLRGSGAKGLAGIPCKNGYLVRPLLAVTRQEILDYLDGKITLDEAVYLIKRDTRHFAKRQLTWFRREEDVIWFDRKEYNQSEALILEEMLRILKEKEIIK